MVTPPRLAVHLIEWRVPSQVRAFLLADLEETFHRMAVRSPLKAKLWYWRQAGSALFAALPGAVGVPTGSAPAAGIWRDVRHALRGVRRSPGQSVAAILTLGLGDRGRRDRLQHSVGHSAQRTPVRGGGSAGPLRAGCVGGGPELAGCDPTRLHRLVGDSAFVRGLGRVRRSNGSDPQPAGTS